jgi:hypothetical protein
MLSSRKCCCLSSARLPWRRSCMQACILASTLQVFRRKCPLDERKTHQREPAPLTFLVRMHPDLRCDLALAGELARASANPACYDCNPILVSSAGAFRELRTYISSGVLMNSLLSFPVSNTSVKVAFAIFVAFASPVASFAQQAGSAATGNVPITTIDPGAVGKCFQASAATTAAHNRHRPVTVPTSVCWAPQNTTDGPGV